MSSNLMPCFSAGHRFFWDCERECQARTIEWMMKRKGKDAWFATMTFKDFIPVVIANRKMAQWFAMLTESVRGNGGLVRVTATEWQQRNVVHFHSIIFGSELAFISRKRWESRWETVGGGFCRIHNASFQAAPYLAKYTSKALGGDLQWSGTLRGLKIPGSIGCCGSGGVDNQGRTELVNLPPRFRLHAADAVSVTL